MRAFGVQNLSCCCNLRRSGCKVGPCHGSASVRPSPAWCGARWTVAGHRLHTLRIFQPVPISGAAAISLHHRQTCVAMVHGDDTASGAAAKSWSPPTIDETQHVAEAAIVRRDEATKPATKATVWIENLAKSILEREQLEVLVANLQRYIAHQHCDVTSYSGSKTENAEKDDTSTMDLSAIWSAKIFKSKRKTETKPELPVEIRRNSFLHADVDAISIVFSFSISIMTICFIIRLWQV